ncbi:MAG: hypothetical protein PSV36_13940 [Algoriphagus sp.]|nr:hypothetical protein [Algoriphagus sp.]
MNSPPELKKQVVMASLFTGTYDVNRNEILTSDDFELVKAWADSVQKARLQGIIFHNGFSEETCEKHQNENLIFIRTQPSTSFNPNIFRYFLYLDFLKKAGSQISDIFLTDISDVVLIRNPFEESHYLENPKSIFCGDEPKTLENEWMKDHSTHLRSQIPDFEIYEKNFANKPLLNCGVIGGKSKLMMDFLTRLCAIHQSHNHENKSAFTGDMGAFNYLIRTQFQNQILHGFPINTVFKEYQSDREDCWFRHK